MIVNTYLIPSLHEQKQNKRPSKRSEFKLTRFITLYCLLGFDAFNVEIVYYNILKIIIISARPPALIFCTEKVAIL